MKRIDDLQVGEWVIFTAVENEQPELVTEGMMGAIIAPACDRYEVDGRGYQVRAISMPFALLWCPIYQTLRSFDLRRVTLTSLDKSFVDVLLSANLRSGILHLPGPIPTPKKLFDDVPLGGLSSESVLDELPTQASHPGKLFLDPIIKLDPDIGYAIDNGFSEMDSVAYEKKKTAKAKGKRATICTVCSKCGAPMSKTATGLHCPKCGFNPQLVTE